MSGDVDLTGTHPCPVPGCRLSAEEHHRVNVGLVMENAELRKQTRGEAPEPQSLADAISEAVPVLSSLLDAFTAKARAEEDALGRAEAAWNEEADHA